MELNDTATLADSMIRLHGTTRALKLADRYAADCASEGDARGYMKWTSVAAKIADFAALDRRFVKAGRV
jgi:hypothetical protein